MLELETGVVLALEPGIVLHSLPDQDWFFAFNDNTGDEFHLNITSFWVLEEIGKGIEWGRLKGSFLETFEVPPQQGEVDLRKLVKQLYKEKIIGRRSHGEVKTEL